MFRAVVRGLAYIAFETLCLITWGAMNLMMALYVVVEARKGERPFRNLFRHLV